MPEEKATKTALGAAATLHAPLTSGVTTVARDDDQGSSLVDVQPTDLGATRGASRYAEGALLGAGGMGEVRLHGDRRIGRRVARKTMHVDLDNPVARERFLREVRVQGQLEHPAIVPVYDLDEDGEGRIWFTMKRVRGETLETVLALRADGDPATCQRFTTRRLLAAFAQVCHAVEYAHSRGVIHRDLKPANVMLGDFGEVYVLDWGLAKVVGDVTSDDSTMVKIDDATSGSGGTLTAGGAILGTLAYMAPEQVVRRPEGIDARVDIYALGVILFEILVEQLLRPKASLGDVIRASRESIRPLDRKEGVPPELDALCASALAPDPDARPKSARELAEGVERYLDGDRDLALRKDLAKTHVEKARATLAELATLPEPGARASLRVTALRETSRALALDADNADGQQLLLQTITDPSTDVPPEAEPELARVGDRERAEGAKLGMLGLLSWLATLPLAIWVGVRNWEVIGALTALAIAGVAYSAFLWRRARYGSADGYVLAAIVAGIVALTSCYMGPFALVPTCAATASLLFAMRAKPRERRGVTALLALGALVPFVVEWLGLVPRAYEFRPEGILIHVRAIALPGGPTMAVMAYMALSFVVIAAVLVGRMRDALAASERRQFVQAWTLRQLFG